MLNKALLVIVIIFLFANPAQADIFKCTNENGQITYTNSPCTDDITNQKKLDIKEEYEENSRYYSPNYIPDNNKTVNVRGYTRKDGTYVRPHTRSAPRK